MGREAKLDHVKHWQGSEISVESDPPQPATGDGEMWDDTPVSPQHVPP